jgi:hypothetical protein
MDSFSVGKLKEICTYLQLIINAVGCVDKENKINETTMYDILNSFTITDEERQSNINGSLAEQIKALNDNISALNAKLTETNKSLAFIDDAVAYQNDVGYLRTMSANNLFWTAD